MKFYEAVRAQTFFRDLARVFGSQCFSNEPGLLGKAAVRTERQIAKLDIDLTIEVRWPEFQLNDESFALVLSEYQHGSINMYVLDEHDIIRIENVWDLREGLRPLHEVLADLGVTPPKDGCTEEELEGLERARLKLIAVLP